MEDSVQTSLANTPGGMPSQGQVVIVVETPWFRIDGEPWLWYNRFQEYFLPLGPGRSLPKAFELMMLKERGKEWLDNKKANKRFASMNRWTAAAREWEWRERARAYDSFMYKDAQAEVELARLTILNGANKAAQALVSALDNERLKVAAAKEILDRAGLPGTTNVGIGPADKFSADELSRAEAEIQAWEKK
jgi:hypothetical protein